MELKKPITYDEQIEKLVSRGVCIDDKEEARSALSNINYYRLSAYLLPFRDGEHYRDISFEKLIKIYNFDTELKTILFFCITQIEISLRTKISYFFSMKYGALGYLNKENFNSKHDANKFLKIFNNLKEENKNILFVKHHLNKYDGKFPFWVAIELFTFSMLSYFYSDMKSSDQKELLKKLNCDANINKLCSWFRCCSELRNIIAHCGRLYYRVFTAVPKGIVYKEEPIARTLFANMLMLKELYGNKNEWNDKIMSRICELIDKNNCVIELKHIGFPIDYKEVLLNRQLP